MSRNTALTLAVAGALSLGGVTALILNDDSSAPARSKPAADAPTTKGTTITLAGYPLSQNPQAAIDFQGNSAIFEGRVVDSPGQARKVEANQETGAPALVYLPVNVQVTAVYKGALKPGDRVVVRDLGGTASDGTTLEYEDSFPDATWKPGAELFVFSNEAVTLNDGLEAMTPNMLYVEDNGSARSARGEGVPAMPVSEMRSKSRNKWGQ